MLRGILLLAAFFAFSCNAKEYAPTIYPLRDGLIPAFNVVGDVKINNDESSTESVTVYKYPLLKLESNYHDITQTMVDQIKLELGKNGHQVPGGPAKKIDIKVTSLVSSYATFYWKSNLSMVATLGDDTRVYIDVKHASGDVIQDLNGCIAEGALKFLKNEEVLAYLARTEEMPATP